MQRKLMMKKWKTSSGLIVLLNELLFAKPRNINEYCLFWRGHLYVLIG